MIKQLAAYITIPFVLALCPLIGWIIGSWLDEKLHTEPYIMFLGIIFGMAAGVREVYRIIKRFGDDS